jgi:hypothetical protein
MTRLRTVLPLVLTAVSLAAGGCSVLGLDSTTAGSGSGSTAASTAPGGSWLVRTAGSATPSAGPSGPRGYRPILPAVSIPAALPDDGCGTDAAWTVDPVQIPLTITPVKGALTVSWPRQYNSNYRIAAIPQPLVSGNQPAYTWQSVAAGSGCTITATVSGLTSGKPYVIWLDAPNSGYQVDGTRHPYAGESGVVYPL